MLFESKFLEKILFLFDEKIAQHLAIYKCKIISNLNAYRRIEKVINLIIGDV